MREVVEIPAPDLRAMLDALPDKAPGAPLRPWTEEEDANLRDYWPKKKQADVARLLGRALHVCRRRYGELEGK